MKGFNIDDLAPEPDLETGFESPLHQFLFNYGDTPIDIAWTVDGHTHQDTLGPEDSVYLQPCDCSGATQQTTELAQAIWREACRAQHVSVQKPHLTRE